MKVAFAGTPEFAAIALEAILAAGFEVPLVLTQPDRPAGRGMQLQPSPVKQVAVAAGIPVHQPEKLRTAEQQAELLTVALDGEYWRPTCVNCGTKMVSRQPRNGGSPFWGCANYPRCKTTLPMRASRC